MKINFPLSDGIFEPLLGVVWDAQCSKEHCVRGFCGVVCAVRPQGLVAEVPAASHTAVPH